MGIENLVKYINVIILILPLVDKIVTMVEGLFSKLGSGQGAAKKEAATEVAKVALVHAGLDLPDEVLLSMVDSVVKIKNQTGEFVKPATRAPPDNGGFKPSEF